MMSDLSANAKLVLHYLGDKTKNDAERTVPGIGIGLGLSRHDVISARDALLRAGLVREIEEWYELTDAGRKFAGETKASSGGITATFSGSPGVQQAVGDSNVQIGNISSQVGSGSMIGGDVTGSDKIYIGGAVGPGAAVGSGASVRAQNIAGGDIQTGVSGNELAQLFEVWKAKAQEQPEPKRQMAIRALEDIQAETDKIEAGDESEGTQNALGMRLKMFYSMASDIGEVVINTLASPARGIATVIRKVAAKVEREVES